MNCWWHQWQISRAADTPASNPAPASNPGPGSDSTALPVGTVKHIARCGRCRAFAAQVRAMDMLLSEDTSPAGHIGTPVRQAGGGLWVRRVATAAAAVLIVAMGVVAFNHRPAGSHPSRAVGPSMAMLLAQSAHAVQSPMQRQFDMMVAEVSDAAQVLVPPWPTPARAHNTTATP